MEENPILKLSKLRNMQHIHTFTYDVFRGLHCYEKVLSLNVRILKPTTKIGADLMSHLQKDNRQK